MLSGEKDKKDKERVIVELQAGPWPQVCGDLTLYQSDWRDYGTVNMIKLEIIDSASFRLCLKCCCEC